MKRILGFKKTKFGWDWSTNIITIAKPGWNPLEIIWIDRELIIRTPKLASYHFRFRRWVDAEYLFSSTSILTDTKDVLAGSSSNNFIRTIC